MPNTSNDQRKKAGGGNGGGGATSTSYLYRRYRAMAYFIFLRVSSLYMRNVHNS